MFVLAQLNAHESIHNLMGIQPLIWLTAYADFRTVESVVLVAMKFLDLERPPSNTNMEQ